jgi:hypothetical protein
MRRFVAVAALAASVACGTQGSGVQPTDVLAVEMRLSDHHNLPVEWNGDIHYVCSTQLRQYCGERCTWEFDHYISSEPCPATPIE